MSNSRIRRALLLTVACATFIGLTGPPAYAAASISANPNHGVPTSTFTLTLTGFTDCTPPHPNYCITVELIQGARVTNLGTADPNGAATFNGTFQVPPLCTATRTTQCSVVGGATVRAHSSTDDASTDFTVDNPATTTTKPTTTTTKPTTTTSSSTSTSTSTSTSSTSTSTSSSTTSTTEVVTTTTRTPKKSSSSSNDDIPRYIAVGLVVVAAAATAAVDTRLRRLG
jgi:hypothetical protein